MDHPLKTPGMDNVDIQNVIYLPESNYVYNTGISPQQIERVLGRGVARRHSKSKWQGSTAAVISMLAGAGIGTGIAALSSGRKNILDLTDRKRRNIVTGASIGGLLGLLTGLGLNAYQQHRGQTEQVSATDIAEISRKRDRWYNWIVPGPAARNMGRIEKAHQYPIEYKTPEKLLSLLSKATKPGTMSRVLVETTPDHKKLTEWTVESAPEDKYTEADEWKIIASALKELRRTGKNRMLIESSKDNKGKLNTGSYFDVLPFNKFHGDDISHLWFGTEPIEQI